MSARLRNLNPYELHKHLINIYCLKNKGSTELLKRDSSRDKTDFDVLRDNHKFLWEEDDEADTWEKQLAKKYYDKLYKEYCICDLTRYKENKVALRWRIEKEVVLGKGQFQCGNKHCNNADQLKSWEVNFAYVEENEKKNALVKVRLCPDCSNKLNYKSKKREIKRLKKMQKRKKKSKTKSESDCDTEEYEPRTPDRDDTEGTTSGDRPTTSNDNLVPSDDAGEKDDSGLWTKGINVTEEKTREEEFEEYLEDLLL